METQIDAAATVSSHASPMKPSQVAQLLSCTALAALFGCATEPAAPPSTAVTLHTRIPNIIRQAETQESQAKGGVVVAVVPELYKPVRADQRVLTPAQPPAEFAVFVVGNAAHAGQVYVQESLTPRLVTQPSRLQFTVRVNNQLDRVFRGQGSVVQFNVAGKLIPFDKTDYHDFINGIVPPRNEAEFKIYGPPLDMLADKGIIGIFVYDVVTATDDAGRVTQKQNYEWYFNYSMQDAQDTGQRILTGHWITAPEYQQYLQQVQEQRVFQQQQSILRQIQTAAPLAPAQ